jgi:hypothetical protein
MSSRVKHPRYQSHPHAPALLPKSLVNGCIGKVRHESERIARRSAEARTGSAPVQIYVYRCRHCKGWHLTRQAPSYASMMPNTDGFEYEEGV